MGERGPAPKRSDQRRRRNQPEHEVDRIDGGEVEPPEASDEWHPVARQWYEALSQSGQVVFYQQSDWATAYILAESMSRDLHPKIAGFNKETGEPIMMSQPINGSSLSAYLKGMNQLLVTEVDRRRASVELQRSEPSEEESGSVSWIDEARAKLHG